MKIFDEQDSEHVWTGPGRLGEVSIAPVPWLEVVRERCRRLRFSGVVELVDELGRTVVWQPWLGGEQAERDNPSGLVLGGQVWLMGRALGKGRCEGFRVTQYIPDLQGRLTEGRSLEGPIEGGTVPRLLSLCVEHSLSADVLLRGKGGEVSWARFVGGQGGGWRSGAEARAIVASPAEPRTPGDDRFEVRLLPLFARGQPG